MLVRGSQTQGGRDRRSIHLLTEGLSGPKGATKTLRLARSNEGPAAIGRHLDGGQSGPRAPAESRAEGLGGLGIVSLPSQPECWTCQGHGW